MKSIKILIALFILISTNSNAQIKNAITETVKIYGNCGMCKKTRETVGNAKKVATVEWNKDTQMATITYDAKKTNSSDILKRIALAGYDNERFLAPDDVYANLHGCCQYDRVLKSTPKGNVVMKKTENADHSAHMNKAEAQKSSQLNTVFENYFAVKDALVQTNSAIASQKSSTLLTSLESIQMEKLDMDVHTVWMMVMNNLIEDTKHIAETKEVDHQRDHFMRLSQNMYALMKVAQYEQPIYYQFCPMANDGKGANWLSKENVIKNPYYGSQMLSCGKTVETIK